MPWIVGGAILGSSLFGSKSSKKAGDTQAAAMDRATQLQRDMYNETKANLSPWMDKGKLSLSELSRFMGLPGHEADPTFGKDPQFGMLTKPFGMEDFQESPAYQFNLSQGQKAIDKAAASRKMYNAPATLQDISKFSQGMASNEFQNAYSNYNNNMNNIWNRLYSMSGSGQNAAAQQGAFGQGAANSMGQSIAGAGAAQAAGQVGAANAISGGVGQGINTYMMNQILKNSQMPSTTLQGIPGMTGDFGGYGGGWAGGFGSA